MALSLLPEGIGILEGGVDGLLRQMDFDAARFEIHKEYSTYYEAGLAVLGGVMGMMDVHPDIFEPLLYGGTALLASKGGQWAYHQANPSKGALTATSTSYPTYGGGPGMSVLGGAQVGSNGRLRNERVGIL